MKFFIRIFSLFICLLFLSCAQVVNPGGGPVDKTPPVVLKYIPDSASLNFNAKQIHLLFNEYIQLKDVSSQLIISPPLKKQPEVKVKYKELIIELEDTLAANTTYAFNFGSSVADITEGNVMENFQYVFSTGTFIDSLSLSGYVKDAFLQTPEKGVLVMLYNTFDDSLPYKKLPNYFSKTKEDGSFRINNIRKGKYKVFALKDANANYLYDSSEESIAFLDTLLELKTHAKIELLMFKEIPKKQFIKRAAVVEFGHIQVVFNKPVTELLLTPLNFTPTNNDWKIEEFSKHNDTLDLWLPAFEKDSIRFAIADNRIVLDTLEMVIPPKTARGRGKSFQLSYTTNVGTGLFDLNKQIVFTFNHPLNINSVNQAVFTLLKDSLQERIDTFKLAIGSTNRTVMLETKKSNYTKSESKLSNAIIPWKENTSYSIMIMPNQFNDLFAFTNDTIKINFKTNEEKFYGTLKLNMELKNSEKNTLELVDAKGEVRNKEYVNNTGAYSFYYLSPGNYTIRLIKDTNGDLKWTTGNYLKHQQPETVIYYPGIITIRSNWDLEQKWILNK